MHGARERATLSTTAPRQQRGARGKPALILRPPASSLLPAAASQQACVDSFSPTVANPAIVVGRRLLSGQVRCASVIGPAAAKGRVGGHGPRGSRSVHRPQGWRFAPHTPCRRSAPAVSTTPPKASRNTALSTMNSCAPPAVLDGALLPAGRGGRGRGGRSAGRPARAAGQRLLHLQQQLLVRLVSTDSGACGCLG